MLLMPTHIDHSARYTASVATLAAAFANEQYWKERLAEVGGPGARLVSFAGSDGQATIEMVQVVAASKLPAAVTAIRPGDLEIKRTEIWTTETGSFSASVEGAPATIGGTVTLAADADATTLQVNGQVQVDVPFFGGKIESVIAGHLHELLEREDGFTQTWLVNNAR